MAIMGAKRNSGYRCDGCGTVSEADEYSELRKLGWTSVRYVYGPHKHYCPDCTERMKRDAIKDKQ